MSEPSSLQLKVHIFQNVPYEFSLWLVAGWTIERIVTRGPREVESEGGVEIVKSPSQDNVVEEVRIEGYHDHTVADS